MTIKSNNSNSNSTPPGSPTTPAPTSFAEEPARHAPRPLRHLLHHPVRPPLRAAGLAWRVDRAEIGRAACRERVGPYVSISVVAVSLKHKPTHTYTRNVHT